MRVAIITISDTAARGEREDKSGPAVETRCRELGWNPVAKKIVADDLNAVRDLLIQLADSATADLILTTGGTGISPRDVTQEATVAAAEKILPGLGERIRAVTGQNFPRAYLSRAMAAVRGRTLILNLPGSPSGAVECLDAVADLLPHATEVLKGARHD
jgi:molybdenum cofactor synthesis domain-containing protein